jgi:hypothetical protein
MKMNFIHITGYDIHIIDSNQKYLRVKTELYAKCKIW